MNKMDSNVKLSMLCQIYGKVLTQNQYEILEDYYNHDFSLSEIAENRNITRQAVRDNLKKGESKLFELEEKLGFMSRMLKQEETIDHILYELSKIKTEDSDKRITKILDNVRKELSCLV